MADMTLGIIYAIKQGDKETHENIIDFMSKYTMTPKEHYSKRKLVEIIKNCFVDYLKTCENPSFAVWEYFDTKRQKENFFEIYPQKKEKFEKEEYFDLDTYCLVITLCLTNVKRKTICGDYVYVNGFRDFNFKMDE